MQITLFLKLVVSETDVDTPLPPPKAAAKTLKSKSLECIQAWHEKFSGVYKKLALGYNFLKHCKKVGLCIKISWRHS